MKFFIVIAIKTGIPVYSTLNMCTGISATNSSSNPGGHQMGLCGNEVSRTGTQDIGWAYNYKHKVPWNETWMSSNHQKN